MITIENNNKYTKKASDTIEGNAYMDEDGIIYICSHVKVALGCLRCFSVCGNYVLYDNSTTRLREVDLHITVK